MMLMQGFSSFLLLQVVPLGTNTYDMMLKFTIRETECRKDSGIDSQGCAYRRGFFVVSTNLFDYALILV